MTLSTFLNQGLYLVIYDNRILRPIAEDEVRVQVEEMPRAGGYKHCLLQGNDNDVLTVLISTATKESKQEVGWPPLPKGNTMEGNAYVRIMLVMKSQSALRKI